MFTSSGGIQIDMGVRRKKSRGEQSLILKVFFMIIGTSFKGRKAYNRVSIFRDKNKKKTISAQLIWLKPAATY